jgi:hypothetical protein
LEQTVIKRTCDFCGEKQEFPAESAKMKPAQRKGIAGWITLVRLFAVSGQLQPVQLHACKDSCAVNAIQMKQLDLPQPLKVQLAEEERMQEIFMRKLEKARQHTFVPTENPHQPDAEPVCAVEDCGLTRMAHAAGEA